ncbi:MAG: T9SS C-terminal target domain-containing protein [Calditrichaeota bacterium]|nr:MAG: T9SS C-terminal target domain-containing protein [Calditrichota bacterium]
MLMRWTSLTRKKINSAESWESSMKYHNLTCLYLLFFPVLIWSEDAYHSALRLQLQNEYNLTDGNWVLNDTEKKNNAAVNLTNVTRKLLTNAGSEPFTEILELKTSARKSNSWDNAARFATTQPVKKGDVLLLVIWMNSIESDDRYNSVVHKFELATTPYTQSLYQSGSIKPGWRQWLLPFQASVDYPAAGSRYQIDMGYMKGTIQIAGVAVINFGTKYKLSQLPISKHHMEYDGREADAPWREAALARIEQIRKGDLTIKVVNKQGQPIRNARVTADMIRHEFGFGTAIATHWFLTSTADAKTYREKLQDLTGDGRSFNMVVFENALKWDAWESDWEGDKNDVVDIIEWLRSNYIRIRGHCLVWPGTAYLPDKINQNLDNPDYLRDVIYDHIFEEAGHAGVQGAIEEWDVINEMIHNKTLENAFGTQDIYKDWLDWAHEADPAAILYINEYSVISSGGQDTATQTAYKTLLQNLITQGAPIGGLGMQGHMGANFTPPEQVLRVFDQFVDLGLRMSITEYDAVGADKTIAADYMRDILIASFSHPGMTNFLMWGFWDGAHWFDDAPIFNKDWTLKPSGEAFIEWVFKKWWTNADGLTDAQGAFTTRAFYGDYKITATVEGEEKDADLKFDRQSGEILLQLDTANTGVNSNLPPRGFELTPAYPNPFNAATTISYYLPVDDHVQLHIYNLAGERVSALIDEKQKAGSYKIGFNADNLPSGVYFFRLAISNAAFDGKLTLVR